MGGFATQRMPAEECEDTDAQLKTRVHHSSQDDNGERSDYIKIGHVFMLFLLHYSTIRVIQRSKHSTGQLCGIITNSMDGTRGTDENKPIDAQALHSVSTISRPVRDDSGERHIATKDTAPSDISPVTPTLEQNTRLEPESRPEPKPESKPVDQQSDIAPAHNSPFTIVLQWLTYAFWGWTILSVIWLLYIVLAGFILKTDLSSVIPYAIAATSVLLPLSFVCDMFYSRKETVKKTGAATVVMVIHAVIFALLGIGVLISAVLTLVQTVVSTSSDARTTTVVLSTLLISALIYGLTFLRTINISARLPMAKLYRFGMLVLVGGLLVLACIGPLAQSIGTKDDRDIVANLSDVNQAVGNYIQDNKKLPASLSDIQMSTSAKALVDKGLVTYKPGEKVANITSNDTDDANGIKAPLTIRSVVGYDYRYQLCVTYKAATDSGLASMTDNSYSDYLYISNHPAGQVCYRLKTSTQ